MNPALERLHPYPFERLRALLGDLQIPSAHEPVSMSIGEPQHPVPALIRDALVAGLDGLGRYPSTAGSDALRAAIADWITARHGLAGGAVDPARHVLPVSGTREALFAFAQCVVDPHRDPLVLMPNPFYQIYEGAALLAGATPWYLNCTAQTGFAPDFDAVPDDVWARCQLIYICNPGNPTGAVLEATTLARLLDLADEHDFVVAADECYSEIYLDESTPPTGLLAVAAATGRGDFRRCMVFNSLSKRSSVPGLRSGFVAGDAALIDRFLLYRTYHGAAMAPPAQAASVAAWRDEQHVIANRALYRAKFEAVLPILEPVLACPRPAAGFFLWPEIPGDDQTFARNLYRRQGVVTLPGSFLSRPAGGIDPGEGRLRLALVAPLTKCVAAAERIRDEAIHIGE